MGIINPLGEWWKTGGGGVRGGGKWDPNGPAHLGEGFVLAGEMGGRGEMIRTAFIRGLGKVSVMDLGWDCLLWW